MGLALAQRRRLLDRPADLIAARGRGTSHCSGVSIHWHTDCTLPQGLDWRARNPEGRN